MPNENEIHPEKEDWQFNSNRLHLANLLRGSALPYDAWYEVRGIANTDYDIIMKLNEKEVMFLIKKIEKLL